jgi:hypothetical protein
MVLRVMSVAAALLFTTVAASAPVRAQRIRATAVSRRMRAPSSRSTLTTL